MALKVIMIKRSLDKKREELRQLKEKDHEFEEREQQLEQAIEEAETEEDETAVNDEIEKFETEKGKHEKAKNTLQDEIDGLEENLKEIEEKAPGAASGIRNQRKEKTNRKDETEIMVRRKFFGMDMQERSAFFANENVKTFLENVREMGRNAAMQKRAITGAELTIPTEVLDLIRQNIASYSKLIKHVRLRPVSGKARQNVMGTIPEAVWTEMCAKLNEIDFGFTQTEVDGYKVGGVIYICQATLEDSDYNLASEIIEALGAAIGIALDKAILYGVGTKMPLGIAARIGQTQEPSDYPATARPWTDLHATNAVTIPEEKHGLDFFKEIVKAGGNAKGKYASGAKFWAMNETTHTTMMVEAMNFNSAGAIVSIQNNTMPVIGGVIEILSDDIIPDGNIIGGYGELYLLAERAGSMFARSDEYRFAEDQVAFKGTARYDGEPVIAEGFVLIGLGNAPETSAKFAGDTANDASLSELTIGTETLSPGFDAGKYAYTVTASGASGAVNAVPTQNSANVAITYGGNKINNGSSLSFSGTKNLVITVTNGASKLVYTVKITK